MLQSNALCSVMTAGLFALSNSGNAAVYDFGNLKLSSPGHISANDDARDRPVKHAVRLALSSDQMNQSANNFSFNNIAQVAGGLVSSNQVRATGSAYGVDFIDGFEHKVDDNRFYNPAPAIPATAAHEAHVSPMTSALPMVAAPVAEPETYAMILAGLALVGFTARRRGRNS